MISRIPHRPANCSARRQGQDFYYERGRAFSGREGYGVRQQEDPPPSGNAFASARLSNGFVSAFYDAQGECDDVFGAFFEFFLRGTISLKYGSRDF